MTTHNGGPEFPFHKADQITTSLADRGVRLLQDAVVAAMVEARHAGVNLGAADISRVCGIFREPGARSSGSGMAGLNDAIVTGILLSLQSQGRVERCVRTGCRSRGGWRISDHEYELRSEIERLRGLLAARSTEGGGE